MTHDDGVDCLHTWWWEGNVRCELVCNKDWSRGFFFCPRDYADIFVLVSIRKKEDNLIFDEVRKTVKQSEAFDWMVGVNKC